MAKKDTQTAPETADRGTVTDANGTEPQDAGEPRSFVEECLDDAYALREERKSLMERIGANRDILRTLNMAGKLTAEQAAEMDEFYPPRTRGTSDETEVNAPTEPANDPVDVDDTADQPTAA